MSYKHLLSLQSRIGINSVLQMYLPLGLLRPT